MWGSNNKQTAEINPRHDSGVNEVKGNMNLLVYLD